MKRRKEEGHWGWGREEKAGGNEWWRHTEDEGEENRKERKEKKRNGNPTISGIVRTTMLVLA